MLKIQFIIRLNLTVQYFFRACDIWLQTTFASKSYVRHGRSLCHVCTKFRFDEDWDVLLPESPLPLLRVEVLVVWYDPCSDDLATFDDKNALISITRAITCDNLIKFAFQDGWQAFFDSIAWSWVYDLVPCFPDQAKSIWQPINPNLCTK